MRRAPACYLKFMTSKDSTHILEDDELQRLRSAFDAGALLRANVELMGEAYAPLRAWGEATSAVFYSPDPLAARERELCLIVILAMNAPEISLAYHVYWALMEGVTPAEICQALGLAGCYAGMPVMVRGITTARRVFTALKRIAAGSEHGSAHVFEQLLRELSAVR